MAFVIDLTTARARAACDAYYGFVRLNLETPSYRARGRVYKATLPNAALLLGSHRLWCAADIYLLLEFVVWLGVNMTPSSAFY